VDALTTIVLLKLRKTLLGLGISTCELVGNILSLMYTKKKIGTSIVEDTNKQKFLSKTEG